MTPITYLPKKGDDIYDLRDIIAKLREKYPEHFQTQPPEEEEAPWES